MSFNRITVDTVIAKVERLPHVESPEERDALVAEIRDDIEVLTSEAYDDGHSDGYSEGEDAGYQDGYDSGTYDNDRYDEGFEDGKEEGYSDGYEAAREEFEDAA
ncbi:hypothetical protein SEA_MANEEKUL_62 [Streptomyces phage Maneekul]|uniref:Uncharacterized protein n=1 Tax=Streptomyces phage Werner TaxID=2801898 RepID=A0A7U0GCW8_9CAUD|nr:hypothetical protein KGG99_gp62 [Streptomyces phage Werner]AWN07430.1 hypothetical protein SEA_MANEEKUL_62 [Streptomyces phage Maneekul]QFP95229.1 hypothetical protein SEA_WHATEVER_62 [Streptomyces phage Whatever]QQO39677.1 hypothetical protein SEA_HIPPO_62 [Streptomyces phage Hippo]QQO39984.1 hypothetical protein SEA_DWAYNE_62 [Streptomyces phage Dwayne]QYW07246.1 hypothetical protein SEA_CHUCKY_62 [Streptomyces phage Chucky]QYW07982.1 hypothetical protein SEA_TRISTE_63 [Streptomyces phag